MFQRYMRNIGPLTPEEQACLSSKTVFIASLGGLGGHLMEHMLRVGVGRIIAADGDAFNCSNLNRQLLCTEDNIGMAKADAAAHRAAIVNPSVTVTAVPQFITEENCVDLLSDSDLVLDGLDNVDTRRILANGCDRRGIPLVHGAVRDWYAQVCVIPPNSNLLDRIYPPDTQGDGAAGCLSPLPALCASVQAAQAILLLCGRKSSLWGKLLLIDLLHAEQALVPLVSGDPASAEGSFTV